MSEEYKVEKNVPVPASVGRSSGYPFKDMETNDSFEFPLEKVAAVRNAASIANRKYALKRFTVRRISPTRGRAWRIW